MRPIAGQYFSKAGCENRRGPAKDALDIHKSHAELYIITIAHATLEKALSPVSEFNSATMDFTCSFTFSGRESMIFSA